MTDLRGRSVSADLVWTGRRFAEGVILDVGDDGRLTAVSGEGGDGRRADLHLSDRALLPGFVNAHSHAFQRGLRGVGEDYPEGAGSFWSWREDMYALVRRLDRSGVFDLSLQAFREMRSAGITCVGEFHYLHHVDPEARDFGLDRAVLDAAAEAGIRIALLAVYYETGGPGKPLEGGQLRFATPDLDGFTRQLDTLAEITASRPTQTLGVVAHSLRALSPDTLRLLWLEAQRRDLPFHLHAEEQRREIEEVEAAHGKRPMRLLLDSLGDLHGLGPLDAGSLEGDRLTVVHGTHTDPEILEELAAAGGHLCVCPLTEGNLGDGLPTLPRALIPQLCLGTDSNLRISPLEEMRWLEYGQRVRTERRGVLVEDGAPLAATLLHAATAAGARSLKVDTGALEAGRWADLTAVDLSHPLLAACPPGGLANALVFGGDERLFAGTWVGGVG